MKLKVSNLGKIQEAEIDIDGITVIAGSNNTGKSTVGKSIFSLFNSLYDLENKILLQKTSSVRVMCRRHIRDLLAHGVALGEVTRSANSLALSLSRIITTQIVEEIRDGGIFRLRLSKVLYKTLLEKQRYRFPLKRLTS